MRLHKRIIRKLLNNFGGKEYVKPLQGGKSTRVYEVVFDGNNSANLFVYKVKKRDGKLYCTSFLRLFKITDIKRDIQNRVISYEIE